MYSTSDFRNGLKILLDDIPYEIVYFQHVKPGKGGAFVRTKLRNLKIVPSSKRHLDLVRKPECRMSLKLTCSFCTQTILTIS